MRTAAQALVGQLPMQCLKDLVLASLHSGEPVLLDSVAQEVLNATADAGEAVESHAQAPSQAVVPALALSQAVVPADVAHVAPAREPGDVPGSLGMNPADAQAAGTPRPSQKRRRLSAKISSLDPRVAPEYRQAQSHVSVLRVGHDALLPASPPQALSQDLQENPLLDRQRCSCRGNCGNAVCKSRKNAYSREYSEDAQLCVRFAAPNCAGFCFFCVCERCGRRGRQESHGAGRWCLSCSRKYTKASSQVLYHTRYGMHHISPDWPQPLQLTARFGYVSQMAPRVEAAFFGLFVRDFLAWRGFRSVADVRHPGDVMYILVVGCARWPAVAYQALSLRQGFEPRTAKASDWHHYLQRLLQYASGNAWKEMFDEISPGRSRVVFGLAWLCKWLRVISKATTGDAPVVSLGVSQTKYVMHDADRSADRIEAVIEGIARQGFRFPHSMASRQDSSLASSQDVVDYCKRTMDVVDQLVGRDSTLARGYACSKFLQLLQTLRGIEIWDELDMRTLLQYLPDENEYLSAILSWTAAEVRRKFGMSPILVAADACYWGQVPARALRSIAGLGAKDILNAAVATPPEPLRTCVEEAAARGESLLFVSAPPVWVSRLLESP